MSLKTFFEEVFLKQESIQDILDLYPNYSEKGFKFERCADLLIKLGFMSIFSNDKYKHIIGNVNEGKIKVLTDIQKYINTEKENSGNKTGVSDITLCNTEQTKYTFISSKYYSKDSSIKDYDIQELITMIDFNKHIYKDYDIYLLVIDKTILLDIICNANSSSNYLKEHIDTDKIIDLSDLEKAFITMKNYIHNNGIENIFNNFIFNKKILIHKFHQKLFEIKIFKMLKDHDKFLLGLKPRSGKTFIVGFIISNDMKNYDNFNILVITPAPNETSSQFLDMFNDYVEFNEFNIIHLNKGSMIENLVFTNKNIIVTSKQLLQNYIDNDNNNTDKSTNKNGITSMKNLHFNYIFFDENHYGGTTDLSKGIISTYKSNNSKLVFLTATYHKTLNIWNIPQECSFYWDLDDEQMCKKENIDELVLKHGNEVIETLDYFDNKDILKSYENMPNLEIITTMFETKIFTTLKEELMLNNSKYGFSLKTLFSIANTETNCNPPFKYEREVEQLLRYISGSKREIDFPDEDKSIFGRIIDISFKKNSRTLLSNSNFTTQLWFLPFGIEQKINDVSKNLKKLMLNDKILKNYEILILNSNIDTPVKDIKEEIKRHELIGKDTGKNGLIVLVGNQCSLGITLEKCDIVLLLNDTISSDKIYQMMYRCMTEAHNKKCGFIVDLNINRVLNTVMDYSLYNKQLNTENKIKYIVENNLINIDSDYFLNKQIDHSGIIKNLLDIWRKDPINGLKKLLKNIEDEILEISNDDQKNLNNIFTKSLDKNNQQNEKVNFGENDQDIQSGKIIKKSDDDTNDSNSIIDSDTESDKLFKEEIKISLTKDVLPFIIPLSCFLTMNNNNKNFVEMLHMIKNNEELLEIFNEQTFIWWNKTNIIDIINLLIKKYIKDNSDIYNITIYIKMKLQSLIDNPEELLNFVNDSLKPKDIEKKKYGEVFTPLPLINEMLDKIPIEVWSDKNLKWLDPANGMGNFMIAIYYRLMKELKDIIVDDQQRKKHILENMLYMSEINKKNCYITKQIFDINNKYKLNIYNGDSLVLDTLKVWNIDKFDIIVGNPPYQEVNEITEKSKGGTNLYVKFINYSFNILQQNGYLLFITPISWLGPSTNKQMGDNLLHNLFLKYDLLYLNINECKKYFNVGSTFSYYLIKNNINENINTIILSEYKKEKTLSQIDLKKYNHFTFLPIHINLETLKLIDDVTNKKNKFNIERSRKLDTSNKSGKEHLKIKKDDKFKYITYHTTTKTFFSDIKLDNYEKSKILLNMAGYLKPLLVNNCNITESKFYIEVENEIEGNKVINFLNSNKILNYINICKYSGFNSRIVLENISYDNLDIDILLNNEIENDNTSISSKSTTTSSKSTKSLTNEVAVLCDASLKKKGETCKNKVNPNCNGRCKRHFVKVV